MFVKNIKKVKVSGKDGSVGFDDAQGTDSPLDNPPAIPAYIVDALEDIGVTALMDKCSLFSVPAPYVVAFLTSERGGENAGALEQEANTYFPLVFEKIATSRAHRIYAGKPFLPYIESDRNAIGLVVKESSRDRVREENFERVISELVDFIVDGQIQNLAIPVFGGGYNKLDFIYVMSELTDRLVAKADALNLKSLVVCRF